MRRLAIVILLMAVALVSYLAARRVASRRAAAAEPPTSSIVAAGSLTQPVGIRSRRDSVVRVRAAVLRQIAATDTYLPAMVAADSTLKRWSDRFNQPVNVFVPEGGAPGYSLDMGREVQNAFARWQRVAGIPVAFSFVRDSTRAEVQVRWISAFPIQRAGQADVRWDRFGWLKDGTLTLATHTNNGRIMPADAIYTVALHEIGHLLGLGHSDDPRDVMYPTTEVHDITARDRRTARLLYSLPPGSLKTP